jgi:hypothetical protein
MLITHESGQLLCNFRIVNMKFYVEFVISVYMKQNLIYL